MSASARIYSDGIGVDAVILVAELAVAAAVVIGASNCAAAVIISRRI